MFCFILYSLILDLLFCISLFQFSTNLHSSLKPSLCNKPVNLDPKSMTCFTQATESNLKNPNPQKRKSSVICEPATVVTTFWSFLFLVYL